MLHLLAYRYVYARKTDDQERLRATERFGSRLWLGFPGIGAGRSGLVVSATEALRSSYAFPTDDFVKDTSDSC